MQNTVRQIINKHLIHRYDTCHLMVQEDSEEAEENLKMNETGRYKPEKENSWRQAKNAKFFVFGFLIYSAFSGGNIDSSWLSEEGSLISLSPPLGSSENRPTTKDNQRFPAFNLGVD